MAADLGGGSRGPRRISPLTIPNSGDANGTAPARNTLGRAAHLR